METRASHILIGSFVLGGLLLAFFGVIWLGRTEFNREQTFYDIYFSGSVAGLNVSAAVRYSGVQIGRVEAIEIDTVNNDRVRVTIAVDRPDVIHENAVASLESQGITGYAFVQITGGGSSPILKKKGDQRYPVIASVPSSLEKVFESAPLLLERIIVVADRLADILNDTNRVSIADTLDNVKKATGSLSSAGNDVQAVLAEGTKTLKTLQGTLDRVNKLVGDADEVLMQKDGVLVQLNATLRDFDGTAKRLGDFSGRLDAMVQENRPALREFSQRSLSDLQQLIAEARTLVSGLTRLTADIERDPARFFFGDRREGYRPR